MNRPRLPYSEYGTIYLALPERDADHLIYKLHSVRRDVKTAAQLAARIHDLRQQEERLWKLCRPDLYHAQQ